MHNCAQQETEFAVGPFTITPQREMISDMSVPLSGANKEMMMERPTLKTDVTGFLKAFTLEVRPKHTPVITCHASHPLTEHRSNRCPPQVWLLTAMSMVAISCATIVLVWAEGRVFGRAVRNIYSHTIMWVLKSLTQESE